MSANQDHEQNIAPRLRGKRALVTGANSGIGRAIALRLAREGAAVVVNYHSKPEAAEAVVKEIAGLGGRAVAVQADVSNEQQVDEMFGRARATFGGLDILVNNAGLETHHPILEMPADAAPSSISRPYITSSLGAATHITAPRRPASTC